MVYFFAGPEEEMAEPVQSLPGKKDFYQISEIHRICGDGVHAEAGWKLVRIETEEVLSLSVPLSLKGAVRHLQYTNTGQRNELQQKSAAEYPASDETCAVLIPIRKSAAWWSLAQDERQKYFEKKAGERNHTAIGLDYAERIFRRLYHSRYLETAGSYDFLTYFEFREQDSNHFKTLLAELRDTKQNAEWGFVDMEIEIWMKKKATGGFNS